LLSTDSERSVPSIPSKSSFSLLRFVLARLVNLTRFSYLPFVVFLRNAPDSHNQAFPKETSTLVQLIFVVCVLLATASSSLIVELSSPSEKIKVQTSFPQAPFTWP